MSETEQTRAKSREREREALYTRGEEGKPNERLPYRAGGEAISPHLPSDNRRDKATTQGKRGGISLRLLSIIAQTGAKSGRGAGTKGEQREHGRETGNRERAGEGF